MNVIPMDSDCIAHPSSSFCANFTLSSNEVQPYVISLCDAMSWMPGCTMRSLCSSSSSSDRSCNPFSVWADICEKDMPKMKKCVDYTTLCSADSVVAQCKEFPSLPHLPTTSEAKNLTMSICSEMPSMAGCELCKDGRNPETGKPCNAFEVYIKLCHDMPKMEQCTAFNAMCEASPNAPVCSGQSKSDDCISNPSNPACSDFTLSNEQVQPYLDDLCESMSWMPGCTVKKVCGLSGGTPSSEPSCHPFNVWADICAKDMPKMKKCLDYTSMCSVSNSTVKQCKEHQMAPFIPTTKEASGFTKSICDEMDMDGCEKCDKDGNNPGTEKPCDAFEVYVKLCKAMPEMTQCKTYNSMCEATPSFPVCSSAPSDSDPYPAPSMRMYFHFGFADYLLFKELVAYSLVQYVLACLVVLALGVLYEGIIFGQRHIETHYRAVSVELKRSLSLSNDLNGEASGDDILEKRNQLWWLQFKRRFIKAGFTLLKITVSYALMLLAMTFNVGIFFCVVVGFALGTFCFWNADDEDAGLQDERNDCCG